MSENCLRTSTYFCNLSLAMNRSVAWFEVNCSRLVSKFLESFVCNVKPRHYEEFFTKASAQLINLQQLWINFQRLNENRVMQKCLFEIFKSKAGDISANPTMISIKIVSFICINSFWSNWWNYTFGHPLAKRWMRFIVYEKQDTNLILVESRFIIK